MNKADHYSWAKPGDKGQRRNVHVDDLHVDSSYQRPAVSDSNTLATARAFSWEAFGALIVMERSNGSMWIVDGQQRWLAAKRRGDISHVPCVVFLSDGPEHEAKVFVEANLHRKAVSAAYKFAARAMSKQEPEATIADWLGGIGYRVTRDGRTPNGICFAARLIEIWKWDSEAAKKAIMASIKIANGKPLCGNITMGLWWVIHYGVDIEKHVERIMRSGGATALMAAIRALAIESGQSANITLCGRAVLSVINKGLTNKVRIKEEPKSP